MKTMSFNTTFNPDNPNISGTFESLVNCLKNNNISGFQNIKLMQSKRQPYQPRHKDGIRRVR